MLLQPLVENVDFVFVDEAAYPRDDAGNIVNADGSMRYVLYRGGVFIAPNGGVAKNLTLDEQGNLIALLRDDDDEVRA